MKARRLFFLLAVLAALGLLFATALHLTGVDLPGVCFNKPGDGVWSIALWDMEETGGGLRLRPRGHAPVLTAADVTDRPARYVADPFLLRAGDRFYLFFEILGVERGVIGVATSPDSVRWRYEKVVLEEPFHLSYPFVFRWQDAFYMIPESGADRSVRLYRASRFPEGWEFVGALVTGKRFADPTLLRDGGRWWLFAGDADRSVLHLYQAEHLTGPWTPHPQSPVVRGREEAPRPGGNLLWAGGRLLRIAQDDAGGYGSSVHAFEILELTPERYREQALPGNPLLRASGSGWNSEGMHQLSTLETGPGRWIAAVDGKRNTGQYTLCVGNMILRIP